MLNVKNRHFCIVVISWLYFATVINNNILFYLYIYLPDSQESDEALIDRVSITPTCFRRCQDITVHLKFNRDMTLI